MSASRDGVESTRAPRVAARHARHAGHRALGALLLSWVVSACVGGGGPIRGSSDPWPSPAVPEWVGEPLTWSKLDAIESWLVAEPQAEALWRLTAELTLAEGRLEIAAELRTATEGPPPVRHAAARAGFERVVADPRASSDQRRRALAGLARLDQLGAAPPPTPGELIARARWGASAPVPARLDPVGGRWTRITVHHSAEVPGTTLDGSIADSTLALRKIQRVHVHQREFGDIGYHFLIDAAGRLFEGRSLRWQGAHAGGILNRGNIGICLLGDFRHRSPSAGALTSLANLLDELRSAHAIPLGAVRGHSDLKQTLCPGDSLAHWVTDYRGGRAAGASDRPEGVRARPASAPASAGIVH